MTMHDTERSATEQDTAHGEAIIAILSTPTISAAAEELGVARSTVYRWLDDEEFQAQLRQARARVFEAALSRMQARLERISDELFLIATSSKTAPATRVAACRWFADIALRGHEQLNLAARVEALERRLEV